MAKDHNPDEIWVKVTSTQEERTFGSPDEAQAWACENRADLAGGFCCVFSTQGNRRDAEFTADYQGVGVRVVQAGGKVSVDVPALAPNASLDALHWATHSISLEP